MSQNEVFSSAQNIASNPSENIWVQANAGTGKTTVLVRRLLRILFRNGEFNNDIAPGILCLTYTNAAAGEMRNRILEQLRLWAAADDDALRELLDGISEKTPATDKDLAYARRVFYMYIDNPDVLKIKTIHSFCEEILHRFPLEAGISPSWGLVSGAAQTVLLQDAFDAMIKQSVNSSQNTKATMDAFYRIVDIKSEYFLDELRELLLSRYRSFFQVEDVYSYRKYFIETTQKILNIKNDLNPDFKPEYLSKTLVAAKNIKNNSKKPAQYIQNIIDLTEQFIDNTINFNEYMSAYLTDKYTIIKNVLKNDCFVEEANRVYQVQQNILNTDIFKDTVALFDLSMAFADTYRKIKQERNLLDFEDLILYTQKLLSKPDVMGWVLSQLDVSLSHILVDEAQDTSPQQWNILRMLAGDFFTEGDTKNNRSLFVVGDTKQSIYGFQNADPHAFAQSRAAIATQIENNYRTIREVALDQSFRSVKPILDTVDCFFENPEIINKTRFYNNKHKCFRINDKGFVEIHNAFKTDLTGPDKNKLYINMIADKIESLVHAGRKPKDIMVLVQKRGSFVDLLSNTLKRRGIAIAGNDRIKLPEFSAIKDMLYLIRVCIKPTDDYSLCCLLKSPLYELKEHDILKLCNLKNNGKTSTIFEVLSTQMPDIYTDIVDTIEKSKKLAPYSFFTYVFNKNNNRKKFISRLGQQVIDPIEEFMTMCLAYERTQPGTLKHFLKWFITGDSEIKRDMDASTGVRIMTVHGSKGLASPVVFLIDTFTFPKPETILNVNHLHNNNAYDVWIWKTGTSAEIQPIIDKNRQDQIAEYYRLLYVAMTRTRDELYIYGCDMDRAPEMVWHKQLWDVFSGARELFINEDTLRITNDTEIDRLFDWCKE